MKAIVYLEYGPPEVLQLGEIDKPTPKDNELLIRVHAAEVTKADCEMRSFDFAVKWFWLPLRLVFGVFKPRKMVLGGYFSGAVEGVGRDVTEFVIGDQVFGSSQLRLGAYGEYLCVPDSYTLVKKPPSLSHEEAASVPLGALNALHFMRKADIKMSEKVLINGAGGSIGSFAVQIAKGMGAEVTAVDSPVKEALLRELGVDHFVDYTQENICNQAKRFDVVFNMVAGSRYSDFIGLLNPSGRYLLGNPTLADMLRAAVTSRFSDKTSIFAFAGEQVEELIDVKSMLESGKIRPVVDRVYSPEQITKAHRRVETEQRAGAVVLSFELEQAVEPEH